jgi:Family of unknown function (DUF5989)
MKDFEGAAREQRRSSLVAEFWQFLQHSKKWWLLPILMAIFVFGVLVFLSGTAAAPFIYTLF